ncbi:hypothetical protein CGH80_18945 [Vibrio parahaemolyticus]|nr:hypothetical protein CGH80_18945 [Vibrio parahaemolyticus]
MVQKLLYQNMSLRFNTSVKNSIEFFLRINIFDVGEQPHLKVNEFHYLYIKSLIIKSLDIGGGVSRQLRGGGSKSEV